MAYYFNMNRISIEDRARIVSCLVEGNSIRSTVRMTGFAKIRYSPAQCMGARKTVISGQPDYAHVSTSFTERQNLSMRMGMRRFTRLTNAFSKKLENHEYAVALYFVYYNFARIHQTLRVTPAMEAGISDHVWTLEEIVSLINK